MSDKELVVPGKGSEFVNNKTDEHVIVFFTDAHKVHFAPIGSSSEGQLTYQEFLDEYELVTSVPKSKPAS